MMNEMTSLPHRRLLVELLDTLQTVGYPLGPGKLMQVEELMRQLPPDTPPEALRTLLAPLFASNPEAQRQFYGLFDQCLAAAYKTLVQEEPLPTTLLATPGIEKAETRSRRSLLATLLALTLAAGAAFDGGTPVTWVLLAAVGAAALLAGWKLPLRPVSRWAYLLALPVLTLAGFGLKLWMLAMVTTPIIIDRPPRQTERIPVEQGESATRSLQIPGDTARLIAAAHCNGQNAGTTPSGGRYAIDSSGTLRYTAAAEALPGSTDTLCAEAVYASRRDTALFVIDILATDVPLPAQDKERLAEIPLPFPDSLSAISLDPEVQTRADFYRRYQWLLKALIFLLAAFAVWAFLRWNERRRAKFVAEIEQRDSPPYVWRIETGEEQRLDFEESLSLLLNRLRRREGTDVRRLDVRGTVKASARRAGRATFVFREQTRPPEYLLLIDRFDANDHRARLFDALYEELRRAEVPVERFFYQGDPRVCFNETHPDGLPLTELLHRHRDARLLLIGEGQRLLLPSSGQLAPWTGMFSGWRRRALLLPKPTREWGRREQTLAGLFAVAPASVQGFDLALEQFETLEQRSPAEAMRRVADAVAEPFEFKGSLLGSLRRHFAEPLIRWIAACAVYPALHWDLTLYLGRTLSEPEDDALLRSANLRQLARLPWFVQGTIPENARLQLIEYLAEQGLETRVRRALDELLRSAPAPAKGSVAWDDYRMNVILNELMLQPDAAKRRELEAEFERFLAAGKQPDFVSFKQLQRQPTRLDLLVPENWKKYLFRHGSSRFGLRRLALLLPVWVLLAAGIALVPVKTEVCNGELVSYQNRLLCLDDAAARLLYLDYLTRDAIDAQNHARADSLRREAGIAARAAQPAADTLPYYSNTAAWYYNYGARAYNCSRWPTAQCPALPADSLLNIACRNFRYAQDRDSLNQYMRLALFRCDKGAGPVALVPVVADAPIQKLETNMARITGGSFTMGCKDTTRDGDCDDDEKPPHEVRVRDFYISRYEVTQAQWRAVMGSDPPELHNKGCETCPVERVSWNDIQEFLKKLNTLTGKQYRLPTEAEWEYAARGGAQSRGYLYSGSNTIDEVAWYTENYAKGNTFGEQKTTRPVGGKKPNELGLYDMSGNVYEWVADCWHGNYKEAPKDGTAWLEANGGNCSGRVVRGGSWGINDNSCRVSDRNYDYADNRDYYIGFRLARY